MRLRALASFSGLLSSRAQNEIFDVSDELGEQMLSEGYPVVEDEITVAEGTREGLVPEITAAKSAIDNFSAAVDSFAEEQPEKIEAFGEVVGMPSQQIIDEWKASPAKCFEMLAEQLEVNPLSASEAETDEAGDGSTEDPSKKEASDGGTDAGDGEDATDSKPAAKRGRSKASKA